VARPLNSSDRTAVKLKSSSKVYLLSTENILLTGKIKILGIYQFTVFHRVDLLQENKNLPSFYIYWLPLVISFELF